MIYDESIFEEISEQVALICPDGFDTADLVNIAQVAVSSGMFAVSAPPGFVAAMWGWLEKTPVKIFARFVPEIPKNAGAGDEISGLAGDINLALKKGAHGAQIFVPRAQLEQFAKNISPIRNDLFFNRDLCIGLDISEINTNDWGNIFDVLNGINVSALLLYVSDEDCPDFVGRVYALMNHLDASGFYGQLHLHLGSDYGKIEQVIRLSQKIRPEFAESLKFFINN